MRYFTRFEKILWIVSVLAIVISFIIFGGDSFLDMIASIIGVSALILCAKGNFIGQILVIIFSTLYGYISYSFSYYGEMITYMCMTLPMAVIALISWLRNPYNGKKTEVKVYKVGPKEIAVMSFCTVIVTIVFYCILSVFNTANIVPSTFSVTTSFVAVYLTYKRSPYFALAYSVNDLVLIILWILAGIKDIRYFNMVVCFVIFFINDIYGFISWKKMEKMQDGEKLDV
ncbi:MAG: nicotinamide riboside transporter PnuC [Lachnospiraceae bacterium]|nr:nicotinamide riboside transporter PnuC [Lachnospiraceae bacterium]